MTPLHTDYYEAVGHALEGLALCGLLGVDPEQEFGREAAIEARNLISAHFHALGKDSPGKMWWHAEAMHPAIFRALRIDRNEEAALFAAQPFRLHRADGMVRILVALPAPRILGPVDMDWLGIDTVLSWDPLTDTAEVLDDAGTGLAGSIRRDLDTLTVYGSPFAFFRALAEDRAQWAVARQMIAGDWRHKPTEPDFSPGLLVIGELDKVRWPLHHMPADVLTHGIDAKALNRVLLRQARIPRAIPRRTQ